LIKRGTTVLNVTKEVPKQFYKKLKYEGQKTDGEYIVEGEILWRFI
jgi:hypothetical protein